MCPEESVRVSQRATAVVSTNPARCRDCYRCVRTCPVKAVRVTGGQAEVVSELCIECASCVRACPQRAKVVRDDLPAIKAALAAGRPVIASVAPSAPAYFPISGEPGAGLLSFEPLARALAALGFAGAGETALAAAFVGVAHGELIAQRQDTWPIIASACPVVVNLVEQYYPDLIPHLAPVVSPMIAHGRYLHAQYGADAFVVFIGPCIAKKGEATDPAVASAVDAVLTFDELERWLAEAGVREEGLGIRDQESGVRTPIGRRPGSMDDTLQFALRALQASPPRSPALLFPLEGGLLGTAQLETDLLSGQVITGSGMEVCQNVLEGIRSGAMQACMVELMACSGGCINGPAMEGLRSVALSRQRVQAYATSRGPQTVPPRAGWPSLTRAYASRSLPIPQFSDAQIEAVLHQVGKYVPEDELNCGSCGYASCREKAVATLRGMAEATMCIPYMRSRAESLNTVVMDVTPNAILIVDGDLCVQDLSRSAEQMFNCSRTAARGKPLQNLLPVLDDFRAVRESGQPVLNHIVHLPKSTGAGELIVEATVVPVEGRSSARSQAGRSLMLAILRDVTEREQHRHELERIRAETVGRTQEVINNQMRVAHEIAGLLGETVAETKVVLTQLTRLLNGS